MIDEKLQEKVMDYLFDEMSPTERKEFEKVLQNSEELQQKLNELKATQSVISGYSVETPDENPSAKISDRLLSENDRPKRTLLSYDWIAVAAILLIALFAGLFSTVQFGQTEQGYYLTFGYPPETVQPEGITEQEMNEIIAQVQAENSLLLNSAVEQIREEQNERFNESLTVLAEYYEERRNRDLMLFTEGLLQLEESTANEINRTNRALNGIIYALSNE